MAVLALLIAQLGALSHAYAHDGYARVAYAHDPHARGPHAHGAYGHYAAGGDASANDDFAAAASMHASSTGSHDPCSDCLAFAPLLSAAGTSSSLPFALPQAAGMAARAAAGSLMDISPLLAFRSRAPPNTL
jgi:hypothetical protein